jgi:hypothetical protein
MFHCAEVSTYPLSVVELRAVNTELGFSSARMATGRFISPALSSPNVHGLHFNIFI